MVANYCNILHTLAKNFPIFLVISHYRYNFIDGSHLSQTLIYGRKPPFFTWWSYNVRVKILYCLGIGKLVTKFAILLSSELM